jgi:Photosynthetic reaction centre cytochrome C subunit
MKQIWSRSITAFILIAAHATAAEPEKTAAEALKNVQILKDVPLSRWNDVMNGMNDALGVTCQHCHVAPVYEKDDLKPKETARAMLRMMRDLNAGPFAGRTPVKCYTCHQGNVVPKMLPPLWTKPEVRAQAAQPPPSNPNALPDADRVFARYREAVGRTQLRSVRLKATMTRSSGPTLDAEMDIFPPDKFCALVNVDGRRMRQVFDGDRSWVATPTGVIQMPPTSFVDGQIMQDALLAVKFPVSEGPRKTVGLERIEDRDYVVLESRTDRKFERLYFDRETGLLFRRYSEARSLVGSAPFEISYEDYREVDGLKMPYLITMRSGTGRTQYRISDIRTNLDFDAERFAMPR